MLVCADVRLIGSSLRHEGRLEVKYGEVWGTVCNYLFDYIDARVVCRSLGLGLVGVYSIYTNSKLLKTRM